MGRVFVCTLAIRSEKPDLALQVLIAVHARTSISDGKCFQLRSWVSPEEALLPLYEIGQLILHRESNSKVVSVG